MFFIGLKVDTILVLVLFYPSESQAIKDPQVCLRGISFLPFVSNYLFNRSKSERFSRLTTKALLKCNTLFFFIKIKEDY